MIMGFIRVPTYFAVYEVTDRQTGSLSFIKEFRTKGAAVAWIQKSGGKGISYQINVLLRRD